ncbi:MAG: hypothetical protein KTR25_07730 [Myxococcales bacterium]|nr:hypothetical protein [Myxococcales bacterium]
MLLRWLNLSLLGAAVVAAAPPEVAFAQVVVAFPRVTGPKPAGRGPTAQGVIAAFEDARLEVLRGPPLRAAAEELGSSVYSIEVAQVADCDYLAVVRISGRTGAFTAKGQVFRVSDGRSVLILEQAYRRRAGAPAAGRSIGTQMAEAILRDSQVVQSDSGEPLGEALELDEDEFEPEDSFEDESAFDSSSDRRVDDEPVDPPDRSEELQSDFAGRSMNKASAEQRLLQFAISSGSRLSSAYNLSAGGAESALSYQLDPLLSVNASAGLYMPIGLIADVDFGFAPATFNITSNLVDNNAPSAQLIDLSGNAGWRFNVLDVGKGGQLGVQPLVSVDYGSTIVEEQGDVSAVNSYSTLAIGGGVRLLLDLPPRWGVDLEGKGGAIVAVEEAPLATGANGSGFRIAGRLRTRFWVFDQLGAQLAVRYELRSISFEGPADPARQAFDQQVTLLDSTIDADALDVVFGVVLAL